MAISTGTLSPTFSPVLTTYTVGPSPLYSTVTVTPTTAEGHATVVVNGTPTASGVASAPIALAVGATPVTIIVTAQNGTTKKTTTITFNRNGASPTDLSSLVVSTGSLSPGFTPVVTTFAVGPGALASSVTITATLALGASTLAINGTPVVSGTPSAPIPLPIGVTPVTVVVTAPDTVTQKTTTIVFNRGGVSGQEAYLKASNTGGTDKFGWSVALSGDTLVVGAPSEDSNATGVNGTQSDNSSQNSGAAYVFVRSGSVWSQEAYLKASNTGAADFFGQSVAISTDTIVVGAHGEASNATGVNGTQTDNSAANAGAAYVFVRNAGTWTQQAYLKASNTGANDEFGFAVAASGDTVVVGARHEGSSATGVNGNQADNTAQDSGAAYVFVRSGTTWTQQAYVKASNTGFGDGFAQAVALSGDTLAVGAVGEDSNATGVNGNQADNTAQDSGAVYVFVRSGTVWSQQAYVKASNTGGNDQFGVALALSGSTLAVAAPLEDSAATGVNGNQADNTAQDSGGAYVFVRSGTLWSQQAYVKASNTGGNDHFGTAVAVAGDTLVVGAELESSNATGLNGNESDNSSQFSGAAYVLLRSGTTWAQQTYLKASNTGSQDALGYALAASVDTVVVGAYFEASNATGVGGNQADNSALGAGAVYVYR